MIRSMTGFGKAESAVDGKKITVEIRSVNSKQLDLTVKAPSVYRMFDNEMRAAASKTLHRGKVDIYINIECEAGAGATRINRELFADYREQLAEMASENGMKSLAGDPATMMQIILRLPDVVNTHPEEISEEEKNALVCAVGKAAANLDEFRQCEGAILMQDILQRVDNIQSGLPKVEPFEKERTDTVRTRLMDNLEKTQVKVDKDRFEQEMIYYLEKFDITEEKVRLLNHCNYFRQVVAEEENPGRKLGFIAQEMGREINTLGSKANHAEIQRIVVGMKDELEKIKEQLLNIL